MFKKYCETAALAAKNIIARGSVYYRVYRTIIIFGLPFLLGNFYPDVTHVGEVLTAKDAMRLLEALNQPMSAFDLMYAYLVPLAILLIVSWLLEIFLCINPKNVKAIQLELIERFISVPPSCCLCGICFS